MIEILDLPARELKGTSERGNYHFFVQKARVVSVDRDGIETADVVEVQANPGEIYEPGDDYIIDPSSIYVGNSAPDRNGRSRKRMMIGASPKLVRISNLAKAAASSKAA